MTETPSPIEPQELARARWQLLRQVAALLDRPMTFLAFVWLGLLVIDFTWGVTGLLEILNHVLWALFALHFMLEFLIAPAKLVYLRENWLTAIALVLPAFRVLRVFRTFRALRAARAARSVGLLRLVTSLNRGVKATRRAARRRGVGYVAVLTLLITFVGAAGMYLFESPAALREAGHGEAADRGAGLASYGEAVWWTAMIMTTMGTDYWPRTAEGRLLCALLALYAFAVFGYITATVASYFLGQDHAGRSGASPAATADAARSAALRAELTAVRLQLALLLADLRERQAGPRGAEHPDARGDGSLPESPGSLTEPRRRRP